MVSFNPNFRIKLVPQAKQYEKAKETQSEIKMDVLKDGGTSDLDLISLGNSTTYFCPSDSTNVPKPGIPTDSTTTKKPTLLEKIDDAVEKIDKHRETIEKAGGVIKSIFDFFKKL